MVFSLGGPNKVETLGKCVGVVQRIGWGGILGEKLVMSYNGRPNVREPRDSNETKRKTCVEQCQGCEWRPSQGKATLGAVKSIIVEGK